MFMIFAIDWKNETGPPEINFGSGFGPLPSFRYAATSDLDNSGVWSAIKLFVKIFLDYTMRVLYDSL